MERYEKQKWYCLSNEWVSKQVLQSNDNHTKSARNADPDFPLTFGRLCNFCGSIFRPHPAQKMVETAGKTGWNHAKLGRPLFPGRFPCFLFASFPSVPFRLCRVEGKPASPRANFFPDASGRRSHGVTCFFSFVSVQASTRFRVYIFKRSGG